MYIYMYTYIYVYIYMYTYISKYGQIVELKITQPSISNDLTPLTHRLTFSDPRPRPLLNLAETWQDKGEKCRGFRLLNTRLT